MATPIKDKLVNLEILKSSQDYIDNKKINKNQGIENNGKFMRVGADGNLVPDNVPIPDVSGQIKEHNENTDSHQDIRTELKKKANSGTTLSDYGITDAVPDSHLTDSKAHEDIRKETAKLKEDLSQLSAEIGDLDENKLGTDQLSEAVNNALATAKASGEFDGEDGQDGATGADGKSAYQIWIDQGNTGTESDFLESLKGEDGQKGEQGIQGIQGETGDKGETGEKGADGTSVTVTNVSESTADGGSNVVTFSDGKTLTVKNGSKGSQGEKGEQGDKGDKGDTGATGANGADGKTPVKGTDYFTTEDKTEMVNLVLSELPTWTGGSY